MLLCITFYTSQVNIMYTHYL